MHDNKIKYIKIIYYYNIYKMSYTYLENKTDFNMIIGSVTANNILSKNQLNTTQSNMNELKVYDLTELDNTIILKPGNASISVIGSSIGQYDNDNELLYQFPDSSGSVGQTMIMGQDNQLIWGNGGGGSGGLSAVQTTAPLESTTTNNVVNLTLPSSNLVDSFESTDNTVNISYDVSNNKINLQSSGGGSGINNVVGQAPVFVSTALGTASVELIPQQMSSLFESLNDSVNIVYDSLNQKINLQTTSTPAGEITLNGTPNQISVAQNESTYTFSLPQTVIITSVNVHNLIISDGLNDKIYSFDTDLPNINQVMCAKDNLQNVGFLNLDQLMQSTDTSIGISNENNLTQLTINRNTLATIFESTNGSISVSYDQNNNKIDLTSSGSGSNVTINGTPNEITVTQTTPNEYTLNLASTIDVVNERVQNLSIVDSNNMTQYTFNDDVPTLNQVMCCKNSNSVGFNNLGSLMASSDNSIGISEENDTTQLIINRNTLSTLFESNDQSVNISYDSQNNKINLESIGGSTNIETVANSITSSDNSISANYLSNTNQINLTSNNNVIYQTGTLTGASVFFDNGSPEYSIPVNYIRINNIVYLEIGPSPIIQNTSNSMSNISLFGIPNNLLPVSNNKKCSGSIGIQLLDNTGTSVTILQCDLFMYSQSSTQIPYFAPQIINSVSGNNITQYLPLYTTNSYAKIDVGVTQIVSYTLD